jgi:replication factor A1
MNMQATTKHDPAPHLDALKKALGTRIGTDVNEQELGEEFQKYLEYGVPPDQAVRTILRHLGVTTTTAPRASAPVIHERLPLAQLPATSPSVHIKARLLSLNTKPVTARGEQKEIIWGLLGDESGTASYTSWRPLEGLEKGDVIEAQAAYTKEFNGQTQINFGERTRIVKLDADAIPRTPAAVQDLTIGALQEGQRGVRISGRILSVAPRQITVQGNPRTVWGGSIADPTGKVEFTSWADHKLEAGQALTIEGGYVRAYRGVPQLSFDADAKLTPLAEFASLESLQSRQALSIRELVARGGGSDILVVATLLDVRPGSGLVLRCTQQGCNRVLAAGMCRIHNKVEGAPDLRIKAVLDDGTASVAATIGRELTEALLGKTLDQCKAEAQAAFRPDLILEQLRERLVGRVYAVRGNALSDDYGVSIIARSVQPHQEGKEAAATLLSEVRAKRGVA